MVLSLLSNGFPFIIQCNPTFGIVIRLAGDTINMNSDIDWQSLNLNGMVLYNADFENHSRWILVIPAFGNELDPLACFEISHLSIHYSFSERISQNTFNRIKTCLLFAVSLNN